MDDIERNPERYKPGGRNFKPQNESEFKKHMDAKQAKMQKTNTNKNKSKSSNTKGRQGRKDSKTRRINLDNERVSRFVSNMERDASNDPSWYASTPGLMQAANIAFSEVTGLGNQNGVAAPGVMAFNYAPSIGGKDTYAINVASNAKYSYVVHANSRNQSYDAPDLMMMILAGKEVFCAIADMIRAYGVMPLYDQRNSYLPDALLMGMGYDPSDLKANYSHMLWDINNLIAQASQIWVPDDMPLITREFWMNTHIYMDSESVKGQYYLYNRNIYYKFSGKTSSQGSSLVIAFQGKYAGALVSWNYMVQNVQTMIDALIQDQDRGIIFGDILKAYSESRIYKLNPLAVDYVVTPKYDPEVLSQLSNIHVLNTFPISLTQAQGQIYENWSYNSNGITPSLAEYMLPTVGMLNLHIKDQPTPEAVMVATRMMPLGNNYVLGQSSGNQVITGAKPDTCGSEVTNAVSVIIKINGEFKINSYSSSFISGATQGADIITRLYLYTAFDWAPPLYTLQGATLPTPSNLTPAIIPYYAILDMENFVWIDTETLRRIHRTALLSEFGVPVSMQN